MIKAIAGSLAIVVVAASAAWAEVVEIPLTGLLGTYPPTEQEATRTVTFQLPAAPLVIHGASFRVSGTTNVGLLSCDEGGPYPWPMELIAIMAGEPAPSFWQAWELMPEESGPFGWTQAFQAIPATATWEFLLDGEAEISLYGAPTPLVGLCWLVSEPPTALVTEAVLIVDADFPVPVADASWGRIKALYEQQGDNE